MDRDEIKHVAREMLLDIANWILLFVLYLVGSLMHNLYLMIEDSPLAGGLHSWSVVLVFSVCVLAVMGYYAWRWAEFAGFYRYDKEKMWKEEY